MGKLKVVKAAYAGACYGVQRALDMTLQGGRGGRFGVYAWTSYPQSRRCCRA